jgi:hypothetical protein
LAIVGSAEVVIRAIGDKLESDIQNALNKAARGAKASGNDAGESFSEGFNKSLNKNIDTSSITKNVEKNMAASGEKAGKKVADGVGKGIKDATPKLQSAGSGAGNKIGNSIVGGINRGFRRRGLLSIAAKITFLIPIIGILGGAISSLVSGLFAMGAAFGSASQASVSLLGGLSALAQGGLVAAIAFNGVGEAIAAGLDPEKASQFAEAMAKLPKPAQDFVKEFVLFGPVFKEIKEDMVEGLFTPLSDSVRRLGPLFALVRDEAQGMGDAVGGALSAIVRDATSTTALGNLGNVLRSNNRVLLSFGFGIGGLTRGLIALLDAATPLTEGLGRAFAAFGQNIGAQLEASNASGTLTANLIVANNAFQTIWQSVKNLSAGLFEMGKIAKPAGIELIEALEDATTRFRNFATNPANADGLSEFFDGVTTNTLAISRLFADLGQAFLRLGANPGIAQTADALTAIVPNLERMLSASIDVGPAIARLLGEIFDFITILEQSGALQGTIDVISAIANGFNTVAEATGPLIPLLIKLYVAFRLFSLLSRGVSALSSFSLGLAGVTRSAQGTTIAAGSLASSLQKGNRSFAGFARGLGSVARTAGPAALAFSGVGESVGLSNTVIGAAIGSFFPGFGTAIGAAAGYALDFIQNTREAALSVSDLNAAIASQNVSGITTQFEAFSARAAELKDLRKTTGIGDFFSDLGKGVSSFQNFRSITFPASFAEQLERAEKGARRAKQALEDLNKANVAPNLSINVSQQTQDLENTIQRIRELQNIANKPVSFNPLDGAASREALQAASDLGRAFQDANEALGKTSPITQQAASNFQQLASSVGASPAALSVIEQRLQGVAASAITIPPGIQIDFSSTGDQLLLNTLGVTQTDLQTIQQNSKVDVGFAALLTGGFTNTFSTVETAINTAETANPTVQVGAVANNFAAPLSTITAAAANTQAQVPITPTAPPSSAIAGILGPVLSAAAPTVPVDPQVQTANIPAQVAATTVPPINVPVRLGTPTGGAIPAIPAPKVGTPIIPQPRAPKLGTIPAPRVGTPRVPKPALPKLGTIAAPKVGAPRIPRIVIKPPPPVKIRVDTPNTSAAQSKINSIKGKTVEVYVKLTGPGASRLSRGGYVTGPGTSTSDSIPAMLSKGEYVIRAAQVTKYRSLLEAINSGAGTTSAAIAGINVSPNSAKINSLDTGSSRTASSGGGGGGAFRLIAGELTVKHDRGYLTGFIQEVAGDTIDHQNSLKPSGRS